MYGYGGEVEFLADAATRATAESIEDSEKENNTYVTTKDL